MGLRDYLNYLDERGKLLKIRKPVSKTYQIAGLLKALEPQPVLFENVIESPFPVVGNILCSKHHLAGYFGVGVSDMIPLLAKAIDNRVQYHLVSSAPCQEVVNLEPDLSELPVLNHFEADGGAYITSAVVIARHPELGQNLDFHRCMVISNREMALRIVPSRHFDIFLKDLGSMDIAICVGNSPNVLLAGATSVEIGVDELEIANALQCVDVVRAQTADLFVPADAEFVLEGTIYLDRLHPEGPFVDLTGTYDLVRPQPVFELKAITHRRDALWQALLPGGLEHKMLMGMPREPTIFREVNRVVKCLDVNLTPGGCSWLHAAVKIQKRSPDDPAKAIRAAFQGHRSCKHVFIVDEDIDIYDPMDIEWAMATRFQGDRDMIILDKEPGSSLDPSAEAESRLTTKIGFDLTRPLDSSASHFQKVPFPQVDLTEYLHD